MFGLFSVYCFWIWVWSFLYVNDFTEISPLISSFIAFIFTAISLTIIRNFTTMLIVFLVLLEFSVFYFNYKKFIKTNKRFTIKKKSPYFKNLKIYKVKNIKLNIWIH